MGSTCSPLPGDLWLTVLWIVWVDVDSFVDEFVVTVGIVVEEVEVASIVEVTVWWVTEIDDSALFSSSAGVDDLNTMVAELLGIHAADAIEGNKTVWQRLCLAIPFLACIWIVREVGTEASGGSSWSWIAGDGWISEVGLGWMRNSLALLSNLKWSADDDQHHGEYQSLHQY